MNNRTLIIIILVIILLLILLWVLTANRNTRECESDDQCPGVCQNGKCVDCSFDSDCCGNEVCHRGKCIVPQGPTCGAPPIFETACEVILGTPAQMTVDLTTYVTEGDSPIDWTTFTFDGFRVASEDPTADSASFENIGCPGGGENEGTVDDVEWGTHQTGTINPGSEFCGPPTESPPGTFTWDICEGGTQTPEIPAETAIATWSHDNAGTIIVDYTGGGAAGSFENNNVAWEISYSVQTEEGCTYGAVANVIRLIPT